MTLETGTDYFKAEDAILGSSKDPLFEKRNANTKINCVLCDKAFTTDQIHLLDLHIRNHLDVQPYQCRSGCVRIFWMLDELIVHNASSHEVIQPLVIYCKFCSDKFTDIDAYARHDSSHRDCQRFECSHCAEIFPKQDVYKRHQLSHTSQLPYSCNECCKCFNRIEDLNVHMRIHRNLPIFPCNLCGRLYSTNKNHSNHVHHAHADVFSDEAPETLDKPVPSKSTSNAHNRECTKQNELLVRFENCYKCHICQLHFVKNKTLCLHYKRNHHDVLISSEDAQNYLNETNSCSKPIILREQNCFKCKQVFVSRVEFVNHLKEEHSADRPFACSICEIKFSQATALIEHMKMHATKWYFCKYCAMSFHHKTSLENHIKRHTGNESMKCDVCNIPYADAKSLKVFA